ncbi:MAG TPA: hypothetical protein VJS92_15550 [Candidatus Polarisedimenticolaceae bacterium]|nr:hypothetical protein [Candidatus Polarisedimenticolaceae bacterium]
MRKRNVLAVALAAVALVAGGVLFASNMGFKLNYQLTGPAGSGGSGSGNNIVALPYNQQTNLVNAFDLIGDINAAAPATNRVISISRYLRSTDTLLSYTGAAGTAFALVPGEGYRVQISGAPVSYIIVGSDNPSLPITLDAPGSNGSRSGTNEFAYPYHSTAANAFDLIQEINAAAGSNVVVSISRFVKSNDSLSTYTGAAGTAFALVPGESYRIVVTSTVTWIPSHF